MSIINVIAAMTRGEAPATFPPIEVSGKDVYFYGTSITAGYPLAVPANRFATVFCAATGAIENNFGLGSSTLEKRSPIDPLSTSNMLDRLAQIPTKAVDDVLIVFEYGMNDWGVNLPNYNPANFVEDYSTVLANALSKGWEPEDILIMAPSYPTNAAFAFYNGVNGAQPAPDRPGMLAFVDATQEVAELHGCRFYNMYAEMEGNSPATLTEADGVHLNIAGHAFYANRLEGIIS